MLTESIQCSATGILAEVVVCKLGGLTEQGPELRKGKKKKGTSSAMSVGTRGSLSRGHTSDRTWKAVFRGNAGVDIMIISKLVRVEMRGLSFDVRLGTARCGTAGQRKVRAQRVLSETLCRCRLSL